MEATVIDTLRYADRLKAAGVESNQAEAMSRALNEELAGGVATKDDLDRAVTELKGDIANVDAKVDAMDAKFEERFKSVDERFKHRRGTVQVHGRQVRSPGTLRIPCLGADCGARALQRDFPARLRQGSRNDRRETCASGTGEGKRVRRRLVSGPAPAEAARSVEAG